MTKKLTVYEGETLDGLAHGEGILKYRDGSVHKGMFEKGKRNGPGTYIFADGLTEKGYWRNDILIFRDEMAHPEYD